MSGQPLYNQIRAPLTKPPLRCAGSTLLYLGVPKWCLPTGGVWVPDEGAGVRVGGCGEWAAGHQDGASGAARTSPPAPPPEGGRRERARPQGLCGVPALGRCSSRGGRRQHMTRVTRPRDEDTSRSCVNVSRVRIP
eukprot:7929219-Pyramimonas_sp.AAC.1